uniref:Kinase non-catalytic C-lobe domain containing 1 n=1 Tax=Aotus nancymaae TaxID=37293 RepID=A0A2K5DST8_AOTNA
MQSVVHAAIFQSLCITPDTLAFNTSGNVCFMEQLSDDPEGAFVPPEFDVTGNTFEAHIYSLGATLKAALEYVAEPTLEPRLSQDLEALLSRMQAEDPGDRPDLQSIVALCEEKLQPTSSCRVCRSLSAVGRRVLSIESFGALQDISESSWRERHAPGNAGPRRPPGDPGTDPVILPAPGGPESKASQGPRVSPTKALLSSPMRNGESHGQEELAGLVLDAECPVGELDRDALRRSRLRKVQTFPRLLPDSPEAALCLPLTRGKSQLPASEFFPPDPRKAFLDGKNGLTGFQAQPTRRLWPEQEPELQLGRAPCAGRRVDRVPGSPGQPETSHPSQGPPPCPADPRDASGEAQTPGDDERIPERARQPGSAASEQCVSLQDLLSQLGRPFREYELWALCLACLRALSFPPAHPDPTYLCLDSVLVAEDGAVLFQPPPANGTYDSFFLAPELAEERLVTEKASVYCVAAVLWTAAKFSVPRNQKLALPRRLKALLLDMAKRSAPERPSTAEAIKVCGSYLLQRGMDSRSILAHLRASTCQVYQEEETISLQNAFSVVELKPRAAPASEPGPGGAPTSPCTPPHSCPCLCLDRHSRPIVLMQDPGVARDQLALAPESQERNSQREREGEGTLCPQAHAGSPSLKAPDGPPGAAPEPLGESVQRGSAQGCPCPPPRAPANQPDGALADVPSPPVLAPPTKASALPQDRGPAGQVLPGVTSGGPRPGAPGPTTAHHGPRHPPKPPRSKATEGPGQEPEGPRATPAGEHDNQSPDSVPERPRPRPLPCVDGSPLPGRTACPSLQEATRLIQEEFAFDGYLDNGLEALIMEKQPGFRLTCLHREYVFALKDLTFATFCGAISEKFCDLYWDEKLLQSLFKVVNGPASPSESAAEEAGSQPEGSPRPCSPSSKRPSLHRLGKEKPTVARASWAPCSPTSVSSMDSDELSRGNFEVGFRPQGSVKAESAQQPEADGDRRAAGGAPGPGLQSCSPGWCSAFYEADCFGADVHSYVKGLRRQQADGALTRPPNAQSPELEQQLMIEKRNYRKTLKFYQKLLQKEKRNKGSDVKTMLSKLKGQLEEMKSRVQFLSLVKTYLQAS